MRSKLTFKKQLRNRQGMGKDLCYDSRYTCMQMGGNHEMKTILQAKDLCKSFSNGSVQQHVLRNLNLEIKEGDFAVVMGSSGSGKSTMLYSLSGIDRPTLGQVVYAGEDISKYSNDKLAVFRRNHCGFVFQQNYLNNTMDVLDNIMVSGLLVSKNRKRIAERAKELLLEVGLTEEVFHKFPTQLSGGEAQRVAIVRGLINEPQILFADEPTGALNSSNTENVLDVMTKFHKNGQTIVMVTHDMRSARRGNRILYLKDGIITGELDLGVYQSGDRKRHDMLRVFLQEMGW